jgi:hypothetical protein
MSRLRTALFAVLFLGACAMPPERTERERALRAAIEHSDVDGFERCSKEAIEREHLALIGTGKLADGAAPATVAIRQACSAFLDQARARASFLHHFRFTVDRKDLQLILEPEK